MIKDSLLSKSCSMFQQKLFSHNIQCQVGLQSSWAELADREPVKRQTNCVLQYGTRHILYVSCILLMHLLHRWYWGGTATQNGQIVTQSGNSANLHIIEWASVSSTDRLQVLYIFEKVFERASRQEGKILNYSS